MTNSEELVYEGCNFFRLRLTYSILSGRPVVIKNIRKDDDAPGIKDFESKMIKLLERITNGTKVIISQTGTMVRFRPGMITGGIVTMDCGTERCLSYFLEPLIMLSPFCKTPLTVKLKGVTNAPGELSVDAMRATWLTVYNKFVLNDERLELKIMARGMKPDGGGSVTFSAPIVKTLRPVQRIKPGKVCKIRGQAFVTKVTPSIAYRMIDSAKQMLHGYISDVYITVDQRKGDTGGNSPGYGLFLSAETTEGVVYHGEALSNPKGHSGDPITAEDIGAQAAQALLGEIFRGGSVHSSAQPFASTFMALCQKDVSKFLYGPLSVYSVNALRHLKSFFEIQFKIEEWKRLRTEEEVYMRIPDSLFKRFHSFMNHYNGKTLEMSEQETDELKRKYPAPTTTTNTTTTTAAPTTTTPPQHYIHLEIPESVYHNKWRFFKKYALRANDEAISIPAAAFQDATPEIVTKVDSAESSGADPATEEI